MSTFTREIADFAQKAQHTADEVFAVLIPTIRSSIVDGSDVTGSQGIPKLSGDLATSWVDELDGRTGRVLTFSPYAQVIENGIRGGTPITYEHGGAPHAMKQTLAGFAALVEDVAERMT